LPRRETRTGVGILPLRNPGIFTLCERSETAWSTACFTCSEETSTVKRTRFSPISWTDVATGPFNQPEIRSRGDAAVRRRGRRRGRDGKRRRVPARSPRQERARARALRRPARARLLPRTHANHPARVL